MNEEKKRFFSFVHGRTKHVVEEREEEEDEEDETESEVTLGSL